MDNEVRLIVDDEFLTSDVAMIFDDKFLTSDVGIDVEVFFNKTVFGVVVIKDLVVTGIEIIPDSIFVVITAVTFEKLDLTAPVDRMFDKPAFGVLVMTSLVVTGVEIKLDPRYVSVTVVKSKKFDEFSTAVVKKIFEVVDSTDEFCDSGNIEVTPLVFEYKVELEFVENLLVGIEVKLKFATVLWALDVEVWLDNVELWLDKVERNLYVDKNFVCIVVLIVKVVNDGFTLADKSSDKYLALCVAFNKALSFDNELLFESIALLLLLVPKGSTLVLSSWLDDCAMADLLCTVWLSDDFLDKDDDIIKLFSTVLGLLADKLVWYADEVKEVVLDWPKEELAIVLGGSTESKADDSAEFIKLVALDRSNGMVVVKLIPIEVNDMMLFLVVEYIEEWLRLIVGVGTTEEKLVFNTLEFHV